MDVCGDCDDRPLPVCVLEAFENHYASLREAARERRKVVQLRNVVEDKGEQEMATVSDTLGKRQPSDQYEGDVNLRTLRALLKMIDDRGWERCAHALLALRVSQARFILSMSSCGASSGTGPKRGLQCALEYPTTFTRVSNASTPPVGGAVSVRHTKSSSIPHLSGVCRGCSTKR